MTKTVSREKGLGGYTDLVQPGVLAVPVCEAFGPSLQQNVVWEAFRNATGCSFEEQQRWQ